MSVTDKRLQLGWAAGIPDVLTDVQPDSCGAHRKHRAARAPLKVTLFIEHAIVGQESLVIRIDQFGARNQGRGVVDVGTVSIDKPDDNNQLFSCCNDSIECSHVVTNEMRLEQ